MMVTILLSVQKTKQYTMKVRQLCMKYVTYPHTPGDLLT